MQAAFVNLKGVALGAVEAARSMANGLIIPLVLPNSAALDVADLVSAVGALQNVAPVQHSSFALSAGAADTSSGAAGGIVRDMGGIGLPLGGMNATAAVFGMAPGRGGTGGQGFGGQGGPGPGGQSGGGASGFTGKWSLYDEKCVLSGKETYNS